MKKQFIHIVRKGTTSLIMLLLVSSCSFLDIDPTAIRTGDSFMNDETNAELAINAAYNSLASHERWSDGYWNHTLSTSVKSWLTLQKWDLTKGTLMI